MKARRAEQVKKFTDIPNIGIKFEKDFALLNINSPDQLKNKNGYKLYNLLCAKTGSSQDPCVLDTFLAAIDFMNGAPPRPWWYYTKERKLRMKK